MENRWYPASRNKYASEEPDFAALGAKYPTLAFYLAPAPGGGASLDFRDPAATRELTRVLLQEDFGLRWWIPDGQLVPAVTNRANYLHWIEDLLGVRSWRCSLAGGARLDRQA